MAQDISYEDEKAFDCKTNFDNRDKTKCILCQNKLRESEETICDRCFDREMREEHDLTPEEKEAQAEQQEQLRENWRFVNSRGQRVF